MGLIIYILTLPAIVIAVVAHEYCKAFISTKFGDPLPAARGRLTLNPAKHLEPIGFIFMLATGYGWGQPTPTSAMNYKDRKMGTILTYTLPSILNLLLGFIFSGLYILYQASAQAAPLVVSGTDVSMYLAALLLICAKINFNMTLFNIIPVYPMDGAKVLSVFLSPATEMKLSQYEKILQMLLMVLVFAGIVSMIFDPILGFLLPAAL